MQLRSLKVLVLAAIVAASVLTAAAPLGAAEQNTYKVTNLVSNTAAIPAVIHDASLRNAWGLTASSSSPWWVSDNAADVSTLYNGNTPPTKVPLTVSVPTAPTGTVFNIANMTGAFPVAGGTSRFLFATEHGQILGWPGSGAAQLSAAQSFDPGAVYKGLAIATPPAGPRLYATDFHNGRVDVWDGSWNLVNPTSSFVDPSIPAGYAPFGIQRIGDTIFVTYAKQDADAEDDVHGQGLGFVDAYDTAGKLQGRVAQHGQLNAPWGLAMAPASFGRFAERPARRQLRRRSDQRLRSAAERQLRAPGRVARNGRQADHNRRALGARVRERRECRPEQDALLHRGPERRDGRALRLDRPGLARSSRARPQSRSGASFETVGVAPRSLQEPCRRPGADSPGTPAVFAGAAPRWRWLR